MRILCIQRIQAHQRRPSDLMGFLFLVKMNATELRQQAERTESDNKAWALYRQAEREERFLYFKDVILPKIESSEKCNVVSKDFINFVFVFERNGYLYDFWPKKNVFRVRSANSYFRGKYAIVQLLNTLLL